MLGTVLLNMVLLSTAHTPAAQIADLMSPPYDEYAEKRDRILAKKNRVRPLLIALTSDSDPEKRGLAAAMLVRLDHPETAKALDAWKPSRSVLMFHNPEPLIQGSLYHAFKSHPSLAFERLLTKEGDCGICCWGIGGGGLLQAVADGPDAFDRLSVLLHRFPYSSVHMARLAPAAAVAPIMFAIEETGTKWILVDALANTCTRDPLAFEMLRSLAVDKTQNVQVYAIKALGQLQDRGSVKLLKDSLTNEALWDVAFMSLLEILGSPGLWEEIASMAGDLDSSTRQAAAAALRWKESAPLRRRELVLATLAKDREPAVRIEALEAIAWMTISPLDRSDCRLGEEVESAVLRATYADSPDVRGAALTALHHLIRSGCRPLNRVIQIRAVELLLPDPDLEDRGSGLLDLDTFIGENAGLVALICFDLGELEYRWSTANLLRLAYDRHGPLTDDKVSALEELDIEALDELVERWRTAASRRAADRGLPLEPTLKKHPRPPTNSLAPG